MAVETMDYLKMLRRLIAAAGRRCAQADEPELRALVQCQDDLDAAVRAAIEGMRERGRSWAYIGEAFGISRQAAQQRWGRSA